MALPSINSSGIKADLTAIHTLLINSVKHFGDFIQTASNPTIVTPATPVPSQQVTSAQQISPAQVQTAPSPLAPAPTPGNPVSVPKPSVITPAAAPTPILEKEKPDSASIKDIVIGTVKGLGTFLKQELTPFNPANLALKTIEPIKNQLAEELPIFEGIQKTPLEALRDTIREGIALEKEHHKDNVSRSEKTSEKTVEHHKEVIEKNVENKETVIQTSSKVESAIREENQSLRHTVLDRMLAVQIDIFTTLKELYVYTKSIWGEIAADDATIRKSLDSRLAFEKDTSEESTIAKEAAATETTPSISPTEEKPEIEPEKPQKKKPQGIFGKLFEGLGINKIFEESGIGNVLKSAGSILKTAIAPISATVRFLFGAIGGTVGSLIIGGIMALFGIIDVAKNWSADSQGSLLQQIKNHLMRFFEGSGVLWIAKFIKGVGEFLYGFFDYIMSSILGDEKWNEYKSYAVSIFSGFTETIGKVIGFLEDVGGDIVTGFMDAVGVIKSVFGFIISIPGYIESGVESLAKGVTNFVLGTFSKLKQWIGAAINTAWKTLENGASWYVSAWTDIFKALLDIGKNALHWLKDRLLGSSPAKPATSPKAGEQPTTPVPARKPATSPENSSGEGQIASAEEAIQASYAPDYSAAFSQLNPVTNTLNTRVLKTDTTRIQNERIEKSAERATIENRGVNSPQHNTTLVSNVRSSSSIIMPEPIRDPFTRPSLAW